MIKGRSTYSRRVPAFLCEVVNTYMLRLEQGSDQSHEHRRALVIKICRGLSDNTGYAAVTQADQHVSLGDRR